MERNGFTHVHMILITLNPVVSSPVASVLPRSFSSRQGANQWLRHKGGAKHIVDTAPDGRERTLCDIVDEKEAQAVVVTCHLDACTMTALRLSKG